MITNELRIGNLVYRIDRSQEIHLPIEVAYKISEILTFSVKAHINTLSGSMLKHRELYIVDLSPIPLTEEWLLKFGFEKDELDSFENTSRLSLYEKDNGMFISMWGDTTVGHIKYVHQLQNLYFALTGEELILKS